jgi:hypothetical protein
MLSKIKFKWNNLENETLNKRFELLKRYVLTYLQTNLEFYKTSSKKLPFLFIIKGKMYIDFQYWSDNEPIKFDNYGNLLYYIFHSRELRTDTKYHNKR